MSKILMVTGASSDIGSGLVRNIMCEYDVILAHYCHWNDELERICKEANNKVIFLQADFLNPESIQNMINEIKRQHLEPDHIVHFPASKMQIQKFTKTKWDEFDLDWRISVHSLVTILQAFIPHMKKQKYGKIVLMLTSCTLDMPPKYQTAYTTVKYALLGLMKSLAAEYAGDGISVNGVSPDMVQTKFLSELPDILVEKYASGRPRKQILQIEDILPIFTYLLSDGANNINGMNMEIR